MGEAVALRNLARKQAGEDVDWINIADARALTELGLAERNRGGWEITSAGRAVLAERGGAQAGDSDAKPNHEPTPMIPPHGS